MIKKVLNVFLASLFVISFLSTTGCTNTLKGIGEDVEVIGKKLQRKTD